MQWGGRWAEDAVDGEESVPAKIPKKFVKLRVKYSNNPDTQARSDQASMQVSHLSKTSFFLVLYYRSPQNLCCSLHVCMCVNLYVMRCIGVWIALRGVMNIFVQQCSCFWLESVWKTETQRILNKHANDFTWPKCRRSSSRLWPWSWTRRWWGYSWLTWRWEGLYNHSCFIETQ